MVVHSDPFPSFLLAFSLIFVTFLALSITLLLIVKGNFRLGAKIVAAVCGFWALYLLVVIAVSFMSPQKIVNIGDTFCEDIWCISVERVTVEPRGPNLEYSLAVKIFSDASTVQISAKGASLYLVDERGRHFPLISNPATVPFDIALDPGQTINTSLTFLAPSDANQLFLAGVRGGSLGGGKLPLIPRILVSLYLGNDSSLLHKQTLLRVL